MLNLSNNADCDGAESMIMARFLDFCGSQTDESKQAEILTDGLADARNKLQALLLDLADKLDAEKQKHAAELASYRKQSEEKAEKLMHNFRLMEQALCTLNEDNNAKTAANQEAKHVLQIIHHRKKVDIIVSCHSK